MAFAICIKGICTILYISHLLFQEVGADREVHSGIRVALAFERSTGPSCLCLVEELCICDLTASVASCHYQQISAVANDEFGDRASLESEKCVYLSLSHCRLCQSYQCVTSNRYLRSHRPLRFLLLIVLSLGDSSARNMYKIEPDVAQ